CVRRVVFTAVGRFDVW
nr:immunoglobulin heavy chain junction region [Macaca mulatta]MOY21451.1 immunoglobulin heavy chain junction region [Macaca mulatta]MOY21835.1 immunoglobulin heavy chain junction region [Macaca mulatta]MOY22154.1 immunoglobulin heavy chain junction region [Macaca mulatta]MOY22352.1 immunoglobulin heavy chain junction region [Macaca mulatta]